MSHCENKETCPGCGDSLIHQSNRGPHESSSAFGQYIHDRGELDRGEWLKMFWLDIDGAIFKKQTGILRFIEHKNHGGGVSQGQLNVLPLLAKMVQLLSSTGLISDESGVFVIYSDPPFDSAMVHQVAGWKSRKVLPPQSMSGDAWDGFLRGESLAGDGDD